MHFWKFLFEATQLMPENNITIIKCTITNILFLNWGLMGYFSIKSPTEGKCKTLFLFYFISFHNRTFFLPKKKVQNVIFFFWELTNTHLSLVCLPILLNLFVHQLCRMCTNSFWLNQKITGSVPSLPIHVSLGKALVVIGRCQCSAAEPRSVCECEWDSYCPYISIRHLV